MLAFRAFLHQQDIEADRVEVVTMENVGYSQAVGERVILGYEKKNTKEASGSKSLTFNRKGVSLTNSC